MKNKAEQIKDNISGAYSSLLPDFFQRPFSQEDPAICDHCIMISDDRKELGPGLSGFLFSYSTFHPDFKCCTSQPDLPNFLVGAILSTSKTELSGGRRLIEELITQGECVAPEGIHASEKYAQADRQRTGDNMDSDEVTGCPYFDQADQNCKIWLFRPANCSTYFCKSVEGIAGRMFWDATNFYLSNFENQLSHYVLHKLGLSSKSEMWEQDKIDFYIKSYEFVQGLDRSSFNDMCGPDLEFILENVQNTYAEATRSTVPARLKQNPDLQYEKLEESKYLYNTGHGRCVLSGKLHGILGFFDGQADNEKVMERILEEQEFSIPTDFLLRLFKNKILVASSSSPLIA